MRLLGPRLWQLSGTLTVTWFFFSATLQPPIFLSFAPSLFLFHPSLLVPPWLFSPTANCSLLLGLQSQLLVFRKQLLCFPAAAVACMVIWCQSWGAASFACALQPASLRLPQLTLPPAWLYLFFFIYQMAPPLRLGLRTSSAFLLPLPVCCFIVSV